MISFLFAYSPSQSSMITKQRNANHEKRKENDAQFKIVI